MISTNPGLHCAFWAIRLPAWTLILEHWKQLGIRYNQQSCSLKHELLLESWQRSSVVLRKCIHSRAAIRNRPLLYAPPAPHLHSLPSRPLAKTTASQRPQQRKREFAFLDATYLGLQLSRGPPVSACDFPHEPTVFSPGPVSREAVQLRRRNASPNVSDLLECRI